MVCCWLEARLWLDWEGRGKGTHIQQLTAQIRTNKGSLTADFWTAFSNMLMMSTFSLLPEGDSCGESEEVGKRDPLWLATSEEDDRDRGC